MAVSYKNYLEVRLGLPEWVDTLRRKEIVAAVRGMPGTSGDFICGLHRDEVFSSVIGGGQADFDEPYRHLAASDRALLYAYLNQPRHLEELYEAFTQLFATSRPVDEMIVIDVGCGPFTGGLALSAVLGESTPFTYIGVDRSAQMRSLGERLAAAAETAGILNCRERQWLENLGEIVWTSTPGWRPVLVIASYLLASPSLEPDTFVKTLDALLDRLGRGPVTVLYTNSQYSAPNRTFPLFRGALSAVGFSVIADDLGSVTSERYEGTRELQLRYALFHRNERRILEV